MIHRLLLVPFVVVAVIACALPSKAAGLAMSGNWNITTCTDPDRTLCGTVCHVFTKVPGTVAGRRSSGTVVSDGGSFPFTGKWLQLDDRISVWGTMEFGSLLQAVFFDGAFLSPTEINGDSAVGFLSTIALTISATGSWNAVKVSTCS